MAFAQQREQGGAGGAGGPKGPPPAGGGGAGEPQETSSAGDIDPLDLNSDGTVSAQEKAAGELKAAMKALLAAVDSDGDQKISSDEAVNFASQLTAAVKGSGSGSGSSSDASASSSTSTSASAKQDSASLSQLLMQAYSRAANNYAQASQLSLSA
jgi:hypothetical protein